MRSLVALGLGVMLFACGGTVAGEIDSGIDSGGGDSATDGGPGSDGGGVCPSTELGKSIYGPCFLGITVNKFSSGFGPPPPQGSECGTLGDTWVLDLASAKLERTNCSSPGPNQPNKQTKTTSTMTPASIDGVKSALKNVVVVSDASCVSDGPTLTMVVRSSGKDVGFGDSKVSACFGTPVTGIDGVVTALLVK